ncbi:testis-expressed protein 11-like isoform X2 [Lytechinus variegatus]|uniref:testis-expressed protein 11-like isoform X2 n=1 Tax=Lytechinus variegatus TaxID=7654 RepID=UPI001BB24B27|nr:testis-expressed protein 11-like isoform X2 [Lytechinus variegatus]
MVMGSTDAVHELESLVDVLCKEDEEERCEGIADQLMELSHSLHKLGCEVLHQLVKERGAQIEQCAVMLWNVAVSKNTGNAIGDVLNAKIRHLASNLAFTSGLSAKNFTVQKRHVMMASKAASAWIDCCQFSMAEQCLSLALEGLEKLRNQVQAPINSLPEKKDWADEKKKEVDREAFKIFCFKAKAVSVLARMCYNFGVDAVKSKLPQHAVEWLRTSFELGKECHDFDNKLQAKSLRLLAAAYLDWDAVEYCQKALNAVSLANAEHTHPFGLHLKVKILLLGDSADHKILQAAVEEAILHQSLSVDLAVETVKLLAKHDKTDIAQTACRRLTSRFMEAPDVGKLLVLQLELLTRNNKHQQARNLVDEIIADHRSKLESSELRHLHTLIWEQAAAAFENSDFSEAILWYNFSLSLLTENAEMEKPNIAKLQRNRASSYINLRQYQKAEEAMREAERNDPTNLYTYFLWFKVAIYKEDNNGAVAALQKLGSVASVEAGSCNEENIEEIHSLISLAAQLAFEWSNRKVAISALESLVKCSSDIQQILTCYRCLTRLRLTISGEKLDPIMEADGVASYLESVLVELNSIAVREPKSPSETDVLKNEAAWFMKVAWNMAIEHSTLSRLAHLFFVKCSKFCELLSNDSSNLGRQKTCLIMAAAASLQMAREAQDNNDKCAAFKKVLEHVYSCQNICTQLDSGVSGKGDRAHMMLLLYEFEALAKLGRVSELDQILKKVLSSSAYDVKTIKTLADLAMEPPANHKQLSKRLLHAAINKHMSSNDIDIKICSKTLQNAIRLCLGEGHSPDTTGREEAWHLYQVAIKLLQSEKKDSYPEVDIVWLMTKAWNTGIYSFSSGEYSIADVWCCLGMELMSYLSALKANYEEKMNSLFAEIQTKIKDSKHKDSLEE